MEEQTQEYKQGFADGFALALAFVGSDLCDEPIEGYTLADYGSDYMKHADHIKAHDCANCTDPVKDECAEVVGSVFCPFGEGDQPEPG